MGFLRQKVSDYRLSRSTQLEPLIDLRGGSDVAVGTARQGQVIRFINDVAEYPQRSLRLETRTVYLRPVWGGASRIIRLICFVDTAAQVAGAGYFFYRFFNAAPSGPR